MEPTLEFKLVDTTNDKVEEYNPFPEGYCDLARLGKLSKYKIVGPFNKNILGTRVDEGWKACNIQRIEEDGWIGLRNNFSPFAEMDRQTYIDLVDSTTYQCPLSHLHSFFYGSIPVMILKKDPFFEGDGMESFKTFQLKCASDPTEGLDEMIKVSSFTKIFNGHGYCQMLLPSDGSGEWILLELNIDSDTRLIIRTWDWYNK